MKLLEIELTLPVPSVPQATVGRQWVLARLHGDPLGLLRLENRAYSACELADLAARELAGELAAHLVRDALEDHGLRELSSGLRSIPHRCPRHNVSDLPWLSAAVCTRNGADRITECLDALLRLDYPEDKLELLVIDNAPDGDATERRVRERSQRFRYIREPRPGLDWARNRAVLESRGEVIAFTDDDASVDRGWARAIAAAFNREPSAMAVTGLVLPDELDTDAQLLFEQYGGFGRGVRRRYVQIDVIGAESAAHHLGTGGLGTGANMAYRRMVFDSVGLFDPALDVGTVTNGGGDLEMFFRVIRAGHLLIYEPAAIVRHRHRRQMAALRTQLANNGIGYYSYLVRTHEDCPKERTRILRHGIWWFWYWNVRRLMASLLQPRRLPRVLVVPELLGSIGGLRRYAAAAKNAAAVEQRFGPQRPYRHEGAAS
jgi:glycosyltransferase involved in cell wall biosynthesis